MDDRAVSYQSAADADDERDFPVPPGVVVLVLALLLIGIIAVGVLRNDRGDGGVTSVTIAQLRADPDRWDNRTVELVGRVEDVRELPLLSQYALYTFRDDTGTMLTLTQKGAPPSSATGDVRLRATYHAKVQLDTALKRIVEDQLGPIAGSAVGALVPGIPLNVVYLEHQSYEAPESG